ncbi:hypothetical protein [Sulfurihydrogenibium azorense]|uniref:hypothetical protein n=1 Tax=Sulfurihydrogenibium azorense TaxID=309806 RepID=UPI00391A61F3
MEKSMFDLQKELAKLQRQLDALQLKGTKDYNFLLDLVKQLQVEVYELKKIIKKR